MIKAIGYHYYNYNLLVVDKRIMPGPVRRSNLLGRASCCIYLSKYISVWGGDRVQAIVLTLYT